MAKWKDHRLAVKDTLKRQGKTTYWLSLQLGNEITPQHLHSYLRGETGISQAVHSKINKILRLRFTDE